MFFSVALMFLYVYQFDVQFLKKGDNSNNDNNKSKWYSKEYTIVIFSRSKL